MVGYAKDNRLLMLDGRLQRITDWAREIGLEPGAIRHRLKTGMTVRQALTTPRNEQQAKRRAHGRVV